MFIFQFTATWVKFFSSAGIPSPLDASYAHLFVKNRMAIDMLPELNKEYLREVRKNKFLLSPEILMSYF